MKLERNPQSVSTATSAASLPVERRLRMLDEYLQEYPCINRAQYSRLTGRSYKQAIIDLNLFIEDGVLMKHGAGRNVVYARKK